MPEYGIHIIFSLFFVFSFQIFSIIWNLPLVIYHIIKLFFFYMFKKLFFKIFFFINLTKNNIRYINRPVMSGPGIYDPTTIMNQDQLQAVSREGWIKLGFYSLSFFYYLYA